MTQASLPRLTPDRYASEIAYFDREAADAERALAPLDPAIVQRYRTNARRRFGKEYRLRLLAKQRAGATALPLLGTRLLEVGCGDGEEGVLLAKLGAELTGVDISPKSIDLAGKRARLAGVERRTKWVCGPLAHVDLPENAYDVVWGDGILHHVIPELEAVMERVVRWVRPGGLVVFAEPVNLSPFLRRARMLLPIKPEGTPDERPLEPADIAILRKHVPSMRVRPFAFLARFEKFFLKDECYERSSPPRRLAANALQTIDYALLSMPPLKKLAGQFVMYGVVRK